MPVSLTSLTDQQLAERIQIVAGKMSGGRPIREECRDFYDALCIEQRRRLREKEDQDPSDLSNEEEEVTPSKE